jgi:ribosomal protein S4
MSISSAKKKKYSNKLIHRKYRRYGDIWGRLALKKRHNFITNLVYNLESQAFGRRRKRLPFKIKRRVKKAFQTKGFRRVPFAFQIHTNTKQVRRKRLSRRGNLLKLRRQISLYYGGGKIRRKTFRRYGRMGADRVYESMDTLNAYHSHSAYSYVSIFESRIDTLLLRSNFVDSIYTARMYVLHRKCFIQGHYGVDNPAVYVQTWQFFGLRGTYHQKLRKALITRLKKHTIISIPSYLYINFTLLHAFKVSFPFSEIAGTGAIFRKIFSYM